MILVAIMTLCSFQDGVGSQMHMLVWIFVWKGSFAFDLGLRLICPGFSERCFGNCCWCLKSWSFLSFIKHTNKTSSGSVVSVVFLYGEACLIKTWALFSLVPVLLAESRFPELNMGP